MRCFLICTWHDDFWPVEEIFNEGGLQQSIDEHCREHGEDHRSEIRVLFPEAPQECLSDSNYQWLKRRSQVVYPSRADLVGMEIKDLYDNTIR